MDPWEPICVANALKPCWDTWIMELPYSRLIKSAEIHKVWVANRLSHSNQKYGEDWHKINTALNNISSKRAYLTEFVDSELLFYYL